MTVDEIKRNLNESLSALPPKIDYYYEVVSPNDFTVTIKGRPIHFKAWIEYVKFIDGFKYAIKLYEVDCDLLERN